MPLIPLLAQGGSAGGTVPPTRVQVVTPTGGYANTATPQTTAAFDVQNGDLLVAMGFAGDSIDTLNLPTWTGTGTWTLRQSVVVSQYCTAYLWTCPVTATATGRTVSVSKGIAGNTWGFSVTTWRNHGGLGVSGKGNALSSAPSVSLTTAANSAVMFGSGDWSAQDGTSRTWRTVNGSPMTEQTYFRNSGQYTVYEGYKLDVGPAGVEVLGLTAPATQQWAGVAVEILGVAAPAAVTPVSASSKATGNSAGSSVSWTVPAPSGLVAGNLLVAHAYLSSTAGPTISTPAGWTLIGSASAAGGGVLTAFYKYVTTAEQASPPANYTFTSTYVSSINWYPAATITQYSGVAASSPIEAFATANSATATTTHDAPSVVANLARFLSVTFGSFNPAPYTQAPSGMTARTSDYLAGNDAIYTYDAALLGAGATNTRQAVSTGTDQTAAFTLTILAGPGGMVGGGSDYTGSAALSGSGTLGGAGIPLQTSSGTAGLSGSGTLAGSGVASSAGSGTAALSGSGTLGGSGAPRVVDVEALSGSGTLGGGVVLSRFNTAEGYTSSGVVVTNGNSGGNSGAAFTGLTAGAITSTQEQVHSGGYAYKTGPLTGTQGTLQINAVGSSGAQPVHRMRAYFYLTGYPTGTVQWMRFEGGGRLVMTAAGIVQYQANGVTQAGNANVTPIPLNRWLRWELGEDLTTSSGTARARVYDTDETTLVASGDWAGVPGGPASTYTATYGKSSNSGDMAVYYFDNLASGVGSMADFGAASTSLDYAGAGDLSGAGTLSGSAVANVAGAATLSGSGSLSGTGIPLHVAAGSSSLSGTGTLTTASSPAFIRSAGLSGAGTLSGSSSAGFVQAGGLSGSGTLSGSGSALQASTGSAAFSGSGSLAATGKPGLVQAGALSGVGTLGATGSASSAGGGTAGLAGSGTLAATGIPATSGTSSLTGAGTLSASGVATSIAAGTSSLSGSGTLSTAGKPNLAGSSSLSGSGTLAGSGSSSSIGTGSAALSGSGSLSGTGSPSSVASGALSGAGALVATGAPRPVSLGALSGTGSLTVSGVARPAGSGGLSGAGTLAATATLAASSTGALSGEGFLGAYGTIGSAPVTYRLYDGATPPTAATTDDGQVTLGTEIAVATAGKVTALHYWQPTTNQPNADLRTVAIYALAAGGTGTLLASQNHNPTGPGWQTVTLTTPVDVAPGAYVIATWHSGGRYAATTSYYGTTGTTNGPLSAPSGPAATAGRRNGTYTYGPALAYPTANFNDANYWNDVTLSIGGGGLSATIALSGSGSLSATATPATAGSSSLSSTGTLEGTAKLNVTGSSVLSGSGTLTGAGVATSTAAGSSSLSGAGTLAATGAPGARGTTGLSGSGTLAGSGGGTAPGTAGLTGSGTLAGNALQVTARGASSLSGVGSLSASATGSGSGSAALSGSGALSATGTPRATVTSSLTGSGTLTAGLVLIAVTGASSLSGTGTLSGFGGGLETRTGAGSLSGTGSLSSSGIARPASSITLSGSGTLGATGTLQARPTIGLAGVGTLSGASFITAKGAAAFAGTGTLTTSSIVNVQATRTLTGLGALTGEGERFEEPPESTDTSAYLTRGSRAGLREGATATLDRGTRAAIMDRDSTATLTRGTAATLRSSH